MSFSIKKLFEDETWRDRSTGRENKFYLWAGEAQDAIKELEREGLTFRVMEKPGHPKGYLARSKTMRDGQKIPDWIFMAVWLFNDPLRDAWLKLHQYCLLCRSAKVYGWKNICDNCNEKRKHPERKAIAPKETGTRQQKRIRSLEDAGQITITIEDTKSEAQISAENRRWAE